MTACLVFLFVARDWVLKTALASAVQKLTGFEARIQKLDLNLAKGVFQAEGLTLLNPPQFKERVFADVEELYLHLDLAGLLKKERTRLYELRLYLRELHLEKDRQGISNVSLLTSLGKSRRAHFSVPYDAEAGPSVKKSAPPFYLDRLELSLRKVSYHDRSSLVPKKLAFDLRIEKQVFEGITDPASIVNVILMKVITGAPLGELGLDPRQLEARLKGTMGKALDKTLGYGGKILSQAPEAVSKRVEGTVSEVQSVAKKKASALLGKLWAEL